MKTDNKFTRNNGLKNFYQIVILVVALLITYQMAGAKKKETPLILINDSVFCIRTSNDMASLYNFSSAKTKVFSALPIFYFEKETEKPLELENWMIENWMPEEKYFEHLFFKDKEEDLKLEKWMTDEHHWKVD